MHESLSHFGHYNNARSLIRNLESKGSTNRCTMCDSGRYGSVEYKMLLFTSMPRQHIIREEIVSQAVFTLGGTVNSMTSSHRRRFLDMWNTFWACQIKAGCLCICCNLLGTEFFWCGSSSSPASSNKNCERGRFVSFTQNGHWRPLYREQMLRPVFPFYNNLRGRNHASLLCSHR